MRSCPSLTWERLHATDPHLSPPVSRKPKPLTLPPGWPSPYHNKCSQRDCTFPNIPQTVKGAYPCRGVPGGFFCEGTYKISSSRAQETERYLKELSMARRAAAVHEQQQQQQRKRTTSEMRRPEPLNYSRHRSDGRRGGDVPVHSYVSPIDDRRHPHPHPHPVYHNHSPPPDHCSDRTSHSGGRPSRPSDARPRPPQLPPRSPSYVTHRPASSQVEAEYITDQIMMRLYPERKIQPRW